MSENRVGLLRSFGVRVLVVVGLFAPVAVRAQVTEHARNNAAWAVLDWVLPAPFPIVVDTIVRELTEAQLEIPSRSRVKCESFGPIPWPELPRQLDGLATTMVLTNWRAALASSHRKGMMVGVTDAQGADPDTLAVRAFEVRPMHDWTLRYVAEIATGKSVVAIGYFTVRVNAVYSAITLEWAAGLPCFLDWHPCWHPGPPG